jgi:hypothetical protein
VSFTDFLGDSAKKLAGNGFAKELGLPSLLYDLSSVASNDKSWLGDAVTIAGDLFRTSAMTATLPLRKTVGFAFDKVLMPVAQASYEAGGTALREPLSAAFLTAATLNPKKSWEERDNISPGQSLAYLQSRFDLNPVNKLRKDDFDIFDPNDRKVFEDDWTYRTLTGAYDTFFTTVTDPLGKIGKAAGLARKAMVTRPLGAEDAGLRELGKEFLIPKSIRKTTIISPTTLANRINDGREEGGEVYSTLSWLAKSDRTAIREYDMVRQSNDADTLAYLLGEAKTVDDVADTLLAVSVKDREAMARLVEKRRDLAFVFDNISDVSKVDQRIMDGLPTNGFVDDPNVLDAAEALLKKAEEDPYFSYLTRLNEKGADLTKRTFGSSAFEKMAINRAERRVNRNMTGTFDTPTSFPTVGFFQPTKHHPLVAVYNFGVRKAGEAFTETPAGYVNTNDSDAYLELTAFGNKLRSIVGADADPIVAQHLSKYIEAGDVSELRGTAVVSFEDLAIASINRSLGISDEAGARIWGAYKSRRSTARDTLRNRKFLMTNDGMVLKIPYLERQGFNATPMVDLENYARVLKENKGLVKAIDGNINVSDPDVDRYIAGIMNDVWKASVLLRLGYTVRNVTEASMSIMAKGYGLVALGDINKEGFRNWYDNRVSGIERLTDKRLVAKGLREDSLQLRQQFADNQRFDAAYQRINDDLVNWLPAAERAFNAGKLTREQYLEIVDTFQYRDADYLYHGSPEGIQTLDNTRPLAMNLTEDMANRYAERGIRTISAADVYKRLTGRAGRVPKNLERSPAAEIGTQEVVERINDEAFTELNSYVNGDFSNAQKFLREPEQFNYAPNNTPELPVGLQRTIQRSVLTKPLTVYRGTTNPKSPFINAQVGDIIEEPAFVSTSYSDDVARNFATPSPIEKVEVLNLKPGGPMTLPGSVSTQIKMKLPKGLNGLDIAETYNQMKNLGYANLRRESMMMVNRESEVLLPAGTKFRVVSRGGNAEDGYAVTVEAILPKAAPKKIPSKAMETIASDLREGFIKSVGKGHQVEILNPQTGSWRAIDPNTVSQKLLTTAQFRIRKPGNQGQTLGAKVFGLSVDLRTINGTRQSLGLNDYPELKAILGFSGRANDWRTRAVWEGKEKQLLNWMKDNGVGKLILPDNKANGRSTVLVNPEMVEAAGQKPSQMLARKRLEAVKKQQTLLGDEARIAQIIERTVANQGGTFNFTGDVPTDGFSIAIRGATHKFSLEQARTSPQAWIDSMADHFEKNLEKFGEASHFGTWVEDIDGVPHIWAEPTNVVMDKAKAAKLGFNRNQKAVADLRAITDNDWDNAFINTKGTGDEGASAEFALGKGSQASVGDVTAGAQSVRRVSGTRVSEERVRELEAIIGSGKYPTEGLVSLIREIADAQSLLRKDREQLLRKLDARLVEETRIGAPRKMQGTGFREIKLYDGRIAVVPDAFQGELGQILASRTDNAETYRRFVDHPAQLYQAQYGNMADTIITPDMPDYYSGYANQVNTFFRGPDKIDPVIEMFLNNMKPEQVIRWLRKDPEGIAYAKRFNVDQPGIKVPQENLNVAIPAEDFVGDLYSSYQRYFPDSEIQEAFRRGEITEQWLRNHFADNRNMPDLVGRTVPTSPEAVGLMQGTQKFIERAFYFLGSLPETTLSRHPLARSIYRAEMKQRADIALAIKKRNFGEDVELTLDDINGIRRDAIEGTRREVNKTLFTIIRKSNAGEKMRYIMPFFNAWENSMRRWAGLVRENPAVAARAGQIVSSLRNQPNMVDGDGNPTDKFSFENKLVVPMPETFIKALPKSMQEAIRSTGTQVSIPIRSLDLIFQGELIAGFGPVVAIPASEIVKLRPELEDVFRPVLPFGPSENILKQVIPPAAQKLFSRAFQDEQWSRTFNTVYRYELIRYKLGERDSEPTVDEVQKLTNSMYTIKMFSNLTLPFAAQYDSPLSWYTQQFRKLQQTHGGDADALFLQMYPDLAEATISSSFNATGAQASQAAFANTRKYSKLVSKIGQSSPEMIGFLVNDPEGKYDFSEAVYAWQYGNSPVPGSNESFRERRNPADLKKDANKKMGWIEFRKNMDLLQHALFQQGFTSFNQSGAEDLLLIKQSMVSELVVRNKDWAADYYSVDRGKWVYRMQSINTMLSDPQWVQDNASRPVVKSLATYMDLRQSIARELATRKSNGLPSTLDAKANADLDGIWTQVVATLMQESLEFSDFYNRFLQNDPVTLG